MAFEIIKKHFHDLSEQRSELLKEIRISENSVISIGERLDELRSMETRQRPDDYKDQVIRAKERRRRLRDEIAEIEHNVRMVETKIAALKMEHRFLNDGGAE